MTVYAYTPDGKKKTIHYPNNTKLENTYYANNRIQTVINTNTATNSVISQYTYLYDKNGNRLQQIEVQNNISEKTDYTYDSADRLLSTIIDGPERIETVYTLEGYDRKTERVTENGTLTKSRGYTYDRLNRLVEIFDDTDILKTKTIAYAYDNNGNTLSKKDTSLPDQDQAFVYDSRNQLIEVKRGPPGSEESLGKYDYNAEGLRVRHRNGDRGDVDYYYDDNAVLEERKANDNSLLAHYRYADRLISLQTQTEIQYYHHDALGSTTNLTDQYGSLKVSYRLDAWGHIRKQQGESINRQIFTGQEHDLKTGLIYFGARYYDPDIGRFITQDPYLGEESEPPSLHRYLYAYSNPTVYIDEEGESATVVGAVAGFFWGFGQMIGGMVSDTIQGKYRSTGQYLALWGQNILAGAMIGASIDLAALSGGTAAMAAGALGNMGFEALTLGGKGYDSWGEFGKSQAKAAAIGAAFGLGAKIAAPLVEGAVGVALKGVAKLPGAQAVIEGGEKIVQKGIQKVTQKASALDDAVMSEFSKESLQKTGRGIQDLFGRGSSRATSRVTTEEVEGRLSNSFNKVAERQNTLAGPIEREVGGIPKASEVANSVERRAYLNQKFGRSGNLQDDITLRGYMKAVEGLDVSTARNGAVFWSGEGNFAKAISFANRTGKNVLETTPGGVWLQNQAVFKRLPRELAIKPWRRLSFRYAKGASGEVNAFVRGARSTSTFNEVEIDALRKNPDVFKYIYRGY